jgi:hypothetical protein
MQSRRSVVGHLRRAGHASAPMLGSGSILALLAEAHDLRDRTGGRPIGFH